MTIDKTVDQFLEGPVRLTAPPYLLDLGNPAREYFLSFSSICCLKGLARFLTFTPDTPPPDLTSPIDGRHFALPPARASHHFQNLVSSKRHSPPRPLG